MLLALTNTIPVRATQIGMGSILLCSFGVVSFWGLGLFGFELVVLLTSVGVASHVPFVAFFTFKAQQSTAPEESTADPEDYDNALFEMLDRINKRIAVTEASKHLHKETIELAPLEVFEPVTEGTDNEVKSNPDPVSDKGDTSAGPSKEPVELPLSSTILHSKKMKRLITIETMLSEDLEIEKRRCRRKALNSVGSFNSLPN